MPSGTDAASEEMNSVWEDTEVTQQFDNAQCVCLQLPTDRY